MEAIFQAVLARLRGEDLTEIYPSFDAVPLEKKSKERFTVLTMEQVQLQEPYPAEMGTVYPFTADFRLDVLSPMTGDPQVSAGFFFSVLVPRLLEEDCTIREIRTDSPKVDLQLQRLVCSGTFRMSGLYVPAESEAAV